MHIKSIRIYGFKSYGTDTFINGFDPLFNAITGLNGSGKSNILDSICFVLGISNLSHVRANTFQELVYKNGQSGITTAVVSIIFDNTDTSCSPLGYENEKEITVTRTTIIGGKNKYQINGHTKANSFIHDFFQSVQLNVNNPHFLIMQGRITKVLNMKPMEILSMVEEAAGTRMYESKKEHSLKILKKKDERLNEIESLLKEQVIPNIEKLRSERKDYLEFSKVTREVEHVTKLFTAWNFVAAQKKTQTTKDDLNSKKNELKASADSIEDLKRKLTEVDQNVAELERRKDEEAGDKLHNMEADLKQKQLEESKVSNALQNLKSAYQDEKKKQLEVEKNMEDEKRTLVKRKKDIGKYEHNVRKLQQACEVDKQALLDAEKHLHDVNAGLVKDAEGKASTIASQMMAAEEEIKRSETEEKMAFMNLESLKKDLPKKEAACTHMDDSYKNNEAKFKSLEKEANKINNEMSKLGYEEGKVQSIMYERDAIERQVRGLGSKIDEITSRFPLLSFDYVNPGQGFNPNKVHGLICNLITVKDPATTLALELAAGGRLMNVVVEDDVTASQLMERGQLKNRYTFIPMNKIMSNPIKPEVVQRAERLVGRGNVHTALSLISFDPRLRVAMEYVFGGVFVCSNMEAATKVTFDEHILRKSVTLEGEVFDPAGLLSGGSMNQRSKILTELANVKEINVLLKEKQESLKNTVRNLQMLEQLSDRYQTLQANYDLKMSELNMFRSKMELSNYHQQIKEVQDLKQAIEDKKAIITRCKESKTKAEKRYKELKQTDSKSARQQELKNAETFLVGCQKQANSSENAFKDAQQEIEQAQLEAEDLLKSITNYEEQINNMASTLAEIQARTETVSSDFKTKRADVAQLTEEVKKQKAILKGHSMEIGKLLKDKDAMAKEIENCGLLVQQLEHDIVKCQNDAKDAEKKVNDYLENYDWINNEKKFFGLPNTEYDFSGYDANAALQMLKQLEETKDALSKSVNMRAQTMLTAAEEQFKDLMKKKEVVICDKIHIENVIEELDDKKKVLLKGACAKVNKDFGSIFSTLLPGAKARLISQESADVLQGLEFKVGFGDVWKESLTELSGGQRSLVALSLILSLLLFKPAPIYILDEVDAALDLSHTQNIGQMLKQHFQKSQFIIVSLKEGMFDNANVLFRTKFVDGVSTVSRSAQRNR